MSETGSSVMLAIVYRSITLGLERAHKELKVVYDVENYKPLRSMITAVMVGMVPISW